MADIIVKNRYGEDVSHNGAARIRTRTAYGNTREFVDVENVPDPVETTVELDFSDGDMEVLPGENEVFSNVVIKRPDDLIPDNIPEGITIAGIIGALSASGGSNIVFATGKITSKKTADTTIYHNLNMVPDIVLYVNEAGDVTDKSTNHLTIGTSEKFAELFGVNLNRTYWMNSSGASLINTTYDKMPITYNVNSYPIFNANEKSFCLDVASSKVLQVGGMWIAIAGLT